MSESERESERATERVREREIERERGTCRKRGHVECLLRPAREHQQTLRPRTCFEHQDMISPCSVVRT
jgi:hypothetical protein